MYVCASVIDANTCLDNLGDLVEVLLALVHLVLQLGYILNRGGVTSEKNLHYKFGLDKGWP